MNWSSQEEHSMLHLALTVFFSGSATCSERKTKREHSLKQAMPLRKALHARPLLPTCADQTASTHKTFRAKSLAGAMGSLLPDSMGIVRVIRGSLPRESSRGAFQEGHQGEPGGIHESPGGPMGATVYPARGYPKGKAGSTARKKTATNTCQHARTPCIIKVR